MWYLQYLNHIWDSLPEDPFPILAEWSRAEDWILRFYAGRELPRCYAGHPLATTQLLYLLAGDPQFRVREGAAWGGVALLKRDFQEVWSWMSPWCTDQTPEVRQTAAMILMPFIQQAQLPAEAGWWMQQLQQDRHKLVQMITKRWNGGDETED